MTQLRTPHEGPKESGWEGRQRVLEDEMGRGRPVLRAGLPCRGPEYDWRLGLGLPGKTDEIQRESGEGPVKVRKEGEASELIGGETWEKPVFPRRAITITTYICIVFLINYKAFLHVLSWDTLLTWNSHQSWKRAMPSFTNDTSGETQVTSSLSCREDRRGGAPSREPGPQLQAWKARSR